MPKGHFLFGGQKDDDGTQRREKEVSLSDGQREEEGGMTGSVVAFALLAPTLLMDAKKKSRGFERGRLKKRSPCMCV
jgi:hypothetical protein